MSNETVQKDGIDEQKVDEVSRFLSKILRHNPEEFGVSLNDRGWASMKSIRCVLNREYDERAYKLIEQVIEQDDKNRFQVSGGHLVDDFSFIRATRGHTCEDVKLPELYPDEDDLQWYRVDYDSHRRAEYVEATGIEEAKRVMERISGLGVNWDNATFTEVEGIHWTEGPGGDSISGNSPPHKMYHQDARKFLRVEKRNNMAGDKGRYVTRQTSRVRDRMDP